MNIFASSKCLSSLIKLFQVFWVSGLFVFTGRKLRIMKNQWSVKGAAVTYFSIHNNWYIDYANSSQAY